MISKAVNFKTALIRNTSILNRYTLSTYYFSTPKATRTRVYIYAEYPVSIPFKELDWKSENEVMRKHKGLISKTYLAGDNDTVGGFYEFEDRETAEEYIQNYLQPLEDKWNVKGTFRIFCKEKTKDASKAMDSPYCN